MSNILHRVPEERITPEDFLAYIEIPAHSKNKYECKHDFNDKACNGTSANTCKSVGTKAACLIFYRACSKDKGKKSGTCERADALRYNVSNKITDCHSASHKYAEGNCRVNMASGDISDRVSHTYDNKTKSKGCQKIT